MAVCLLRKGTRQEARRTGYREVEDRAERRVVKLGNDDLLVISRVHHSLA